MASIGLTETRNTASRQRFEYVLSAGEQLLKIINDVLDFSKIEEGRLGIEKTTFRLTAVVEEAISMVSQQARQNSLEVATDFSGELPACVIDDPLRLRQVLLNLLSNAVKFTDRGGVTVFLSWIDGIAGVRITDSGIGMGEEQLSHLFLPFEQGDSSTTRKYGGTGLGLTTSQRLAEMMGGTIEVESTPGAGSVFTLRLPLAETQPG